MEFLETVESIKAEDASVQRLFRGDGESVRVRRRADDPRYMSLITEAAEFVADVHSGRRPMHHLVEVMTTSDFPLLFGDIMDRQVLANYQEAPSSWPGYAKRGTVRDFRTANRYAVNGAEATLDIVREETEYPEKRVSEARYQLSVVKYGRKMPFSWETMINDDLDALKDAPERMGRAARRTEEKFATQLFADANGPHASFYTAGNKNIINIANGGVANNPPLSVAGIKDAFNVLSRLVDVDGEPIIIDAVTLVVPPALEVAAQEILNATAIEMGTVGQGAVAAPAAETRLITANWIRTRLKLVVNAYLPIVSTTNGNTAWYMFASPTTGRPALEMAFLRGHEQPEIFMKAPNSTRVGGGLADPMDGDFELDSIIYKIRHVLGGARQDPKSTVASNGTGA